MKSAIALVFSILIGKKAMPLTSLVSEISSASPKIYELIGMAAKLEHFLRARTNGVIREAMNS